MYLSKTKNSFFFQQEAAIKLPDEGKLYTSLIDIKVSKLFITDRTTGNGVFAVCPTNCRVYFLSTRQNILLPSVAQ